MSEMANSPTQAAPAAMPARHYMAGGALVWVLAGIALWLVFVLLLVNERIGALPAWGLSAAAIAVVAFAAGTATTSRWCGALIDRRFSMSLSRLQALTWTILVVSAYGTFVMVNIARDEPDPLAVRVPEELWLVLGISATSAVGKTLILQRKETQQPTQQAVEKFDQGKLATGDTSIVEEQGVLAGRTHPSEARWIDMFTGDELGNTFVLDLGKLQMFYFTLLTVGAYAIALANLLGATADVRLDAFPELDPGMVALFGISHAGYLAAKLAPHTPTQSPA